MITAVIKRSREEKILNSLKRLEGHYKFLRMNTISYKEKTTQIVFQRIRDKKKPHGEDPPKRDMVMIF